MTDFLSKLYNLLSDKNYYSLSVDFISEALNTDIRFLISPKLSQLFQDKFHDKINTFVYNKVTYIGLP
jgi:hypothetical protein